jgi:large subunit ribosomal protein L2
MSYFIKSFKSTTSGLRHQIRIKKNLLCKRGNFFKKLKFGIKRCGGRSSLRGNITVNHQGGGTRRVFRCIDYSAEVGLSVNVTTIYDSFRTCFICLYFDLIKKYFWYSLATNGVTSGSLITVNSTLRNELMLGSRLRLSSIPLGAYVSCLSFYNDGHVKYVKAAGTFAQLIQKNESKCQVRLPSGVIVSCSVLCFATLGSLSNSQNNLQVLGKAGRSRHISRRPSVRGIAMNPVDHPHGGRSNGGGMRVTPWGMPTHFYRTRKKKL